MRSAIQPDAILYMKFRRIIGRQKKNPNKDKKTKQNKTETNKQTMFRFSVYW